MHEFVEEAVAKRLSEDVNFLTHLFAANKIYEKLKVANYWDEVHGGGE